MLQYTLVVMSTLLKDRKGVSSLEYAILAFGVIAAVSTALTGFSGQLSTLFGSIVTQITADSAKF
jgi:Flp pilus assembly pilin Flp